MVQHHIMSLLFLRFPIYNANFEHVVYAPLFLAPPPGWFLLLSLFVDSWSSSAAPCSGHRIGVGGMGCAVSKGAALRSPGYEASSASGYEAVSRSASASASVWSRPVRLEAFDLGGDGEEHNTPT